MFYPTFWYFYIDISVMSVTFCNSATAAGQNNTADSVHTVQYISSWKKKHKSSVIYCCVWYQNSLYWLYVAIVVYVQVLNEVKPHWCKQLSPNCFMQADSLFHINANQTQSNAWFRVHWDFKGYPNIMQFVLDKLKENCKPRSYAKSKLWPP